MSVQRRNPELVNILKADFQALYDGTYSWKTVTAMHLALPGLRAFWPMSSVWRISAPGTPDMSGQGNTLLDLGGAVEFGYDPNGIAPIVEFTGAVGQYLLAADGGALAWADILGNEANIRATQRGLTLGGWFWWSALPGAAQWLIAKDNQVGGQQQYHIRILAGNTVQFSVWAGPVSVTSTATINAGWNHIIGIYDAPNQDLHIVLNGVVTSNLGAAPAVLPDTVANFTVGADGAGANRFTGYASMCPLCACNISTVLAQSLYWHAAALYGIRT